jgi:polyphosphate kinase 2 (PPK2 family)
MAKPATGKRDTGRARRAARDNGSKSDDGTTSTAVVSAPARMDRKTYEKELAQLDLELSRLQEWIRHAGLRVVVIFEGRDAAGKGGTIKTISASLNPRICRVVALGTPTERQKTQWYFQRYVEHLPAAGEMVFFDRSW